MLVHTYAREQCPGLPRFTVMTCTKSVRVSICGSSNVERRKIHVSCVLDENCAELQNNTAHGNAVVSRRDRLFHLIVLLMGNAY
jgi:hypothetical protein